MDAETLRPVDLEKPGPVDAGILRLVDTEALGPVDAGTLGPVEVGTLCAPEDKSPVLDVRVVLSDPSPELDLVVKEALLKDWELVEMISEDSDAMELELTSECENGTSELERSETELETVDEDERPMVEELEEEFQ